MRLASSVEEASLASVRDRTTADEPSVADRRIGRVDTANVEATLPPGTYYFVCNQPGHYKSGMRFTYEVK